MPISIVCAEPGSPAWYSDRSSPRTNADRGSTVRCFLPVTPA
jgi:hypothetical protein